MRRLHICGVLLTLVSCQGKSRPFADEPTPTMSVPGSGSSPSTESTNPTQPVTENAPEPPVEGAESPTESLVGPTSLESPEGVASAAGAGPTCGADAGPCSSDAGAPEPVPCVPSGPR